MIDLTASSSTEEDLNKKKGEEQRGTPDEMTGIVQNPEKTTCPIKATTKWELDKKPPETTKRSSERIRVPTKRYMIDLIQLDEESEN